MNKQTTSLAAVVTAAGPCAPAVVIGLGAAALLAWLLADNEQEAPASPSNPGQPAPRLADTPNPRYTSGQFASRVTLSDLRAVFADGPLPKAQAVATLCHRTGCSRSAAYHILTRRLAVFLSQDVDGRLRCEG